MALTHHNTPKPAALAIVAAVLAIVALSSLVQSRHSTATSYRPTASEGITMAGDQDRLHSRTPCPQQWYPAKDNNSNGPKAADPPAAFVRIAVDKG
ncbi:hypothetical protein [Nocardia xishanensis]|uniref:hypothetical protein n=1 Tax=Nocardia xishanensis TaxID=238964 RepID=UPI00342EC633